MIEIYFYDLKEEAQKKLLEQAGIKDPKEANWDVWPICTFEISTEEEM